jgi:hypothetical protein
MAVKKKNVLWTILLVLIGLLAVLSLSVKLFGGKAVKTAIQTAGSAVLKVPVKVQSVSLAPWQGKLEMKDLQISNPEGYEHSHLLTMGSGLIHLNTGSLFSDTVQIEQIHLAKVEVVIEQKGLTNNLQQILKNLPKVESEKGSKPAETTPSKSLLIKDLLLEEVSVKVKLLPVPGKADTITLKLAPIHMTDVGKDGKINVGELTAKILTAIASGLAQQGKDLLPADLLNPLQDAVKETGRQVLEAGQTLLQEGKNLGQGVGEAVQGLFKKKEE